MVCIKGDLVAQLLSNGNLDFRQFNIWAAIDQFDQFGFWDNANPSVDGEEILGFIGTYQAEDLAGWWTGAPLVQDATSKFLIGAEAAVLDANNNAVSGWVTGMFLSQTVDGATGHFTFAGFRVEAVRFQQVAMTRHNIDDIALLKAGLSGADRITGSDFADYAYGWTGNDKLFGNDGNDTLSGDAGKDMIRGGKGNDLLKGGKGNDAIFGDAGRDRLEDGLGTDVLTGGAGADSFVFVLGEIDGDRVADFEMGVDTLTLDVADPSMPLMDLPVVAHDITGGVRFDFDNGDVLTVLGVGVTKAGLIDQIDLF